MHLRSLATTILPVATLMLIAGCEPASVECEFNFECETNETCIAGLCVAEEEPCQPTAEVCDGVDNDCDGEIDEDALDATSVWTDDDSDGFGSGDALLFCEPAANYAFVAGDCDDTDASVHPGADERCDGVDDDCDDDIDEDAVDRVTLYVDGDGDGIGAGEPVLICPVDGGYAASDTDCDDTTERVSPEATEVCDGVDNDCDGGVDEGVTQACGGCAALDAEPGDACGACGAWACDGVDALSCEEALDWCGDGTCIVDGPVRACECPHGEHGERCEFTCDDGIHNGAEEVTDCGGPCGECELWQSLSVGMLGGCGIRLDGTIRCWGDNTYGQAEPPGGDFDSVSYAGETACAISLWGDPICWGRGVESWSEAPDADLTSIATGSTAACGITTEGGRLLCWGEDTVAATHAPADDGYVEIALGSDDACARHASGDVHCWQATWEGGMAAPSGDFAQIAMSRKSACGLASTGDVRCWGDEVTAPAEAMIAISGNGRLRFCGLSADRELRCWGLRSAAYDLGLRAYIPGPFDRLLGACGARSDGTTACAAPSANHAIRRIETPSSVEAGDWFGGCAVGESGVPTCWGSRAYSGVTDAPVLDMATHDTATCWVARETGQIACTGEVDVAPVTGQFVELELGSAVMCGLGTDSLAYCVDADGNRFGFTEEPLSHLSLAASVVCGIAAATGVIHCWGDVPASVASTPEGAFAEVAVGVDFACAAGADQPPMCWGESHQGQTEAPDIVLNQLTAGLGHACGIDDRGVIHCWGDNTYGQTDVPAGLYRLVDAGPEHTCAIRDDGELVCWGAYVW